MRGEDAPADGLPGPGDAERPMPNAWGFQHGAANARRPQAEPGGALEARRALSGTAGPAEEKPPAVADTVGAPRRCLAARRANQITDGHLQRVGNRLGGSNRHHVYGRSVVPSWNRHTAAGHPVRARRRVVRPPGAPIRSRDAPPVPESTYNRAAIPPVLPKVVVHCAVTLLKGSFQITPGSPYRRIRPGFSVWSKGPLQLLPLKLVASS